MRLALIALVLLAACRPAAEAPSPTPADVRALPLTAGVLDDPRLDSLDDASRALLNAYILERWVEGGDTARLFDGSVTVGEAIRLQQAAPRPLRPLPPDPVPPDALR